MHNSNIICNAIMTTLNYAPCLACNALFGSLLPAMCNHKSCAQVHELSQSHCGDNREGTHCFHDCMSITPILLLCDLSNLCVVDHLWPLIYIHIYHYIRQTITNSRFHATLCFIHVLLNFLQT